MTRLKRKNSNETELKVKQRFVTQTRSICVADEAAACEPQTAVPVAVPTMTPTAAATTKAPMSSTTAAPATPEATSSTTPSMMEGPASTTAPPMTEGVATSTAPPMTEGVVSSTAPPMTEGVATSTAPPMTESEPEPMMESMKYSVLASSDLEKKTLACSGLLTVGKLTWLEETVGEVNRVEREDITSIQVHSTGKDWLNIKSHVTSFQSLGCDVVTLR